MADGCGNHPLGYRDGSTGEHYESIGFDIFETGFGVARFLGIWLLSALYDIKLQILVVTFGTIQVFGNFFMKDVSGSA